MNRVLRITSGFLLLLLLLNGCKKNFDFYKRPANLAQGIYQQLVARKNFTSLIACIDKAGYKNILSNAGYWTFFAPNDSAFLKYFKDNGLSGVKDIDSATARKIVTYGLVYNSFRKDQLSNYQATTGLVPNQAFKRQTAFYDFVTTENGTGRKIIGSNRNGSYATNDNNNKSIPYFTDKFMNASGLSAADYNFFYPNSNYTGFNVADAKVVHADIVAENGMIQEIDRVVLPRPNIEQYMASNSNYDLFRSLLAKMVYYVSNGDLTHRYHVLSGSNDSVYVKMYQAALAFSPNNENYLNGNTDAQIGGFTMMVPTNDVLSAYTNKILKYYKTFDLAPPQVLIDLLNAHMWTNMVWPSKFAHSSNYQSETPTTTIANIVDKQLLSNGIFYGMNKVQEANVFRTIYSEPYLNPAYTLMTMALNAELKYSIINPSVKYTMFMMPDVSIRAAYYDWNTAYNAWSYTIPGSSADLSTNARDRLYRILQTSVTQPNVNPTDLSGSGVMEMWNNEYVKYNNNQIVASGNVDKGNYIQVDSVHTLINGNVYYTHEVVPAGKTSTGGLLTFTENPIGYHLSALATADPTNFGYFYSYLINSP
ncbi:MAG: fasciclin domain-containing protein, partial [Bacteroidota bacterium]|nr:fasciclin domain-containing protein [Bacteroidota bacterium]